MYKLAVTQIKRVRKNREGRERNLAAELLELQRAKAFVKVGVLGGEAEKKREEGGPTNAQIAVVHEYGAPSKNIPPRPFIRPPLVNDKDTWFEGVRQAYVASRGKPIDDYVRRLGLLGQRLVASTRAYVRNSANFDALAAKTKERKGSSKPLLDSGQLVRSIDYTVNRGGK